MERVQSALDFFGEDGDVISTLPPSTRVAYARDNARLFVGTVINNPSPNINQDAVSIGGLSTINIATMSLLSLTKINLAAVAQASNTLYTCRLQSARLGMEYPSIAALNIDCSNIRVQLKQIENLLQRNGEELVRARFEAEVLEEYQRWLLACRTQFFALNRPLERSGLTNTNDMDKTAFEAKLQCMWASTDVDKICPTIGRLATGIGVLLSAFQSENAIRASRIMNDPETKIILASITNDASFLREPFLTADGSGVVSTRSSVICSETFGFDEMLRDTDLYRKTLSKQAIRFPPKRHQHLSDATAAESVGGGETLTTIDEPEYLKLTSQFGADDIAQRSTSSGYGSDEGTATIDTPTEIDIQANVSSSASLEELTNANAKSDMQLRPQPLQPRSAIASTTTGQKMPLATDKVMGPSPGRKMADNPLAIPRKDYPSLRQILAFQSATPYTFLDFYLYMRDFHRNVAYLDFWCVDVFDVSRYSSLCRHFMRDRTRAILQDSTDDGSLKACFRTYETSATYLKYHRTNADLRVSATKILHTYILPGGEGVLALPNGITDTLLEEVENGRHDPEIFDAAKDYVLQIMERDYFPGFINLGRPLFRLFRKSKNLGPSVNRLVLGGASTATAAATRACTNR
ncbi:hypothetical protein D6C78_08676 [Aureobasidium pullulans]|uniref:RGS domain-containing protein n=1 Tax=Aureobasidium pullulans TaxID=5580 RepID=A0A4T0BK82_AURPU|nr:hypothetical protein D6C78_08676 [Aureobasidium pullulans]